MDIQQTIDLTYTKVDEINEKVNRVLTRTNTSSNSTNVESKLNENSTKLDELNTTTNEINTNIDSINENLTEIETNVNEINTKLNNLETNITEVLSSSEENATKIEKIDTNVETIVSQTENLVTMNNNITTINSNTATTNNNVLTIKTDVQDLKTAMANTYFNNKIEQSLDRIINYINAQENKNTFQTDPYALDLPYSEKLTTNRNPSNKDYYSIDEEFTSKAKGTFFLALIYCAGTTMDLKFQVSFTCSESVTLNFIIANQTTKEVEFEAGTHSYTLELSNVSVWDNRSVFNFKNTTEIVVHSIQLELSGEQILYLNRQRKYQLCYSPGKIVVNKFENFKGYHLILDNIESLSPDMLEKPYTLAAEKVVSYGMNYYMCGVYGKYIPYGEMRSWVNLSHDYGINYNNGNYTFKSNSSYSFVYSNMCCYMDSYVREATTVLNNSITISGAIMSHSSTSTFAELADPKHLVSSIIAADLNRFDTVKRTYYVLEDFAGNNYVNLKAGVRVPIGFGKNATAFLDAENDKLLHIYLNDNGYCVKKDCLIGENLSGLEILNQKIIGTYDFYFETNSDVYFVVKNNELLMFKKTI